MLIVKKYCKNSIKKLSKEDHLSDVVIAYGVGFKEEKQVMIFYFNYLLDIYQGKTRLDWEILQHSDKTQDFCSWDLYKNLKPNSKTASIKIDGSIIKVPLIAELSEKDRPEMSFNDLKEDIKNEMKKMVDLFDNYHVDYEKDTLTDFHNNVLEKWFFDFKSDFLQTFSDEIKKQDMMQLLNKIDIFTSEPVKNTKNKI